MYDRQRSWTLPRCFHKKGNNKYLNNKLTTMQNSHHSLTKDLKETDVSESKVSKIKRGTSVVGVSKKKRYRSTLLLCL